MKLSRNLFVLTLSGVILMTQLSCGDNPTSSTPNTGTVKISVKGVSLNSSAASVKTAGIQAGLVTITSARVVIDKIEFESSVGDTLDFEFEQPFVQDLVVGSDIHEIGTVQVPFGSYKETEIEIDDLGSEDGAVYTQNPELQNRSIVVKGYLNNDSQETFTFTSDLSEEQEREFEPPLVLDQDSPSTNVVLFINMDMWFVDKSGTLVDPRSPNNKEIIEENIKASLEIFEDEDDDGDRDDD